MLTKTEPPKQCRPGVIEVIQLIHARKKDTRRAAYSRGVGDDGTKVTRGSLHLVSKFRTNKIKNALRLFTESTYKNMNKCIKVEETDVTSN